MLGRDSADTILAATAYDQSGDKIGSVGRLYMDDHTGEPAWVSVRTGMFGTKENFVPLQGASLDGDRLIVAVTQDAVKHAPQVDLEEEHLGLEQSQELYRYYGIAEPGGDRSDADDADGADGADGADTDGPDRSAHPEALGAGSSRGALDPSPGDSGPSDPPPPPAMTPQTGDSDVRESGTPGLRLRRHVVHEEQTITVPVVREEYVLEGEPEDDDTGRSPDPASGPAPTPPPRGV